MRPSDAATACLHVCVCVYSCAGLASYRAASYRRRGAAAAAGPAPGPVRCAIAMATTGASRWCDDGAPRAAATAAEESSAASILLLSSLPAALASDLQETGYAVCDNVATGEVCAALRSELAALGSRGWLQPASLRLRTAGPSMGLPCTSSRPVRRGEDSEGVECAKAGVNELSVVLGGEVVEPQALVSCCPTIRAWLRGRASAADDGDGGVGERATMMRPLLDALNAAAPWLQLTHLDTMKLQYNEGVGGCFPMHSDSTEVTGRRVTAILYLNDE
eukprot:COSAG01_NODE_1520_length_10029_cov_26.551374_2_plen_276_part_00